MTSLIHRSLKHFNQLMMETNSSYHEAAQKLGLTDSEMMILYAVVNFGEECASSDIARLNGVSRQTIHSALKKLEAAGQVRLTEGIGRKKNVRLTEQGKELAERTVLPLIQIENEIFDSWTEEEQKVYLQLVQRYLDRFREKIRRI